MHKNAFQQVFCAALMTTLSGHAHATDKQMPIDFVGEWCNPSTYEGRTNWTLPSWTDEGKCTNILSVEKWGFSLEIRGKRQTCLPEDIRLKKDKAPSGTAYMATIGARCSEDGTQSPGHETLHVFDFERYKGNIYISIK